VREREENILVDGQERIVETFGIGTRAGTGKPIANLIRCLLTSSKAAWTVLRQSRVGNTHTYSTAQYTVSRTRFYKI